MPASGGVVLTERPGARLAQPQTQFEEDRLVHVVSEICTAAHMPRPAVMVLPHHGGIGMADEYAGSHHSKRLTQLEMTWGDTLHHQAYVSDHLQEETGVFA